MRYRPNAHEGVSVSPCKLLDGNDDFCDTFFDDMKVPKENLVGELNAGWAIAKGLLVHERTMMSQIQEFIPGALKKLQQAASAPTTSGG